LSGTEGFANCHVPPLLPAAPLLKGSQFSEALFAVKKEVVDHDVPKRIIVTPPSLPVVSAPSSSLPSSSSPPCSSSTSVISVSISTSSATVSSTCTMPAPAPVVEEVRLAADERKLPERKTKCERKPTLPAPKPAPAKRARKKKRSSDDSDYSEFDSNDSGSWAESKKERNKKAASNYRKRRKQYVTELEGKVDKLNKDKFQQFEEIQSLKERLENITDQLMLAQESLRTHHIDLPASKKSSVDITNGKPPVKKHRRSE